jgi:hypothetical protein
MAALDPHARIAMLERELEWAHLKIQVLEERLRQHNSQTTVKGEVLMRRLALRYLRSQCGVDRHPQDGR